MINRETLWRAWSTILTRRGQVEVILREAGWNDIPIRDLFDELTAKIEFHSKASAKQVTWVDQTSKTEQATPTAGIQGSDADVGGTTASEFRWSY